MVMRKLSTEVFVRKRLKIEEEEIWERENERNS